MSTPAGRPYLGTLRSLEKELALPLPMRTRMLRELEFDLEALGSKFVAEGMPLEEARARAVDALVPDAETLRALGRVHQSRYRKLTAAWGSERIRAVERGTLALATGSVVLAGAAALARADLLADPSPFLWPVLMLGGAIAGLWAWKTHELWIRQDHRRPARGLGLLVTLVLATAFLGAGGALVDTYLLAGLVERAPADADSLVIGWVRRESALVSVSILVALTGSLGWFVLRQWVVHVAAEHREALGHPANQHSEGDTP